MNTPDTVTVQYIGRRESFPDHLFGTGLVFEQGQARALPAELARKFLRHADQFTTGDKAALRTPAKAPAERSSLEPDVDQALARMKQEQDQAAAAQAKLQDMYDQVAAMGKTALVEFAKVNYRQELDQKAKVGDLRLQVRAFIDQFGVV